MSRKRKAVYSVDPADIKDNVVNAKAYTGDYKHILETFSKRFNDELELQEIKQEKFSEDTDTSTGGISNYRRGKRLPESKLLPAMAKELGVSLDYLFGLTDLKTPDIENKAINNVTGLTDESIIKLKKYMDIVNSKDSLLGFKQAILDKFLVINYLIAHEDDTNIFSLIADFLWDDYKGNALDVLFKGLDKDKIENSDYEEAKKTYENTILIETTNKDNKYKGIRTEDLDALNILLIQKKLYELKDKLNNK